MIRFLFLIPILFSWTLSYAQEKNEVEKRISANDAPGKAVEWLNSTYDTTEKTKWFYQTDGINKVYEAKLKHKKQLHSVEFNLDGSVKNIEIKIKKGKIPENIKESIIDYFDNNYKKYSIKKIQIQYTGDQLEQLIKENDESGLRKGYEIEYYGRTEKENELWEGLFGEKGNLIQKRKIVLNATDNLDY